MSLSPLLSNLQELSRSEKLLVVQYLLAELVQEEFKGLYSNLSYPIYSPYCAYEAADTMLNLLNSQDKPSNEPTKL